MDIEAAELEQDLEDSSIDPLGALEMQEQLDALSRATAELNENDKYFLELYYKRELKPEQVANILGISVNTVYSRVSRLKKKISEILDQHARKTD